MDKEEYFRKLVFKVTELYKAFNENSKIFKNQGYPEYPEFTSFRHGTVIRFADDKEINAFNEIINFILSYDKFYETFSEYYIFEQIIQLFHKILKDNKNIDEYAENFFENLIDTSNIEWYILSKMDDVEVSEPRFFQIIDCTIKLLEMSDLPYDIGREYEFYNGKTCIFTTVRAGDSEKARNIALDRFNICYNLLRLYTPNHKKSLKGILVTGNQNLIIWNISKKNSYDTIKPSLNDLCNSEGEKIILRSVSLSNRLYKEFEQDRIQYLLTVNPISDVVKDCLYWYGLGLDATMYSAKLINFTTVLESALKTKNETTELKLRISDRCAFLLGDNYEARVKIHKEIGSIYNERSKIVHRGALIKDQDIVTLAGSYAKSVLIKLIQENSRLKGNFSEFIMEIDQKKFL